MPADALERLLPPDALRAVLSLLSAGDLSSVGATSSAMRAAVGGDALWQRHALQMPRWQLCGNPLPSQPDGRCVACDSPLTRMVADAPPFRPAVAQVVQLPFHLPSCSLPLPPLRLHHERANSGWRSRADAPVQAPMAGQLVGSGSGAQPC